MKRYLFRLAIPFLISGWAIWGLFTFMNVSVQATDHQNSVQTVSVMAPWSGEDQDSFLAVLDEFTNQAGISTTYEYVQDTDIVDVLLNCTASSTCPDAAIIFFPHQDYELMSKLVGQGALIPLESIVTDFDRYYTTTWRSLSSVNDTLYAVPFKADLKSLIWYRPQAFAAISATVPSTWAELLNLSDQLVSNGQTPFAIGAESGPADGWPLSDWFENILLREGGPEAHRKLTRHDIAWTHPTVVETMQRFTDIVGQDDYQAGGITGTLNTYFVDALYMVFGSSPSATMYSAAPWIREVVTDTLLPGVDYDLFAFPEIDPAFGSPLMGSADLAVLFNGTPEAQLLVQFLATPDAAEVWAARDGFLSPNGDVDLNVYPDVVMRTLAELLIEADEFVYDLDDQLPAQVQQCVWSTMMDFVANQDQLTSILQNMEDCATTYQGLPYRNYLPVTLKLQVLK